MLVDDRRKNNDTGAAHLQIQEENLAEVALLRNDCFSVVM